MTAIQTESTQGRVLVLDTNAERAEELSNRLRCLNYDPVTPLSNCGMLKLTDIVGIAVLIGDVAADQGVCRAFRTLADKQLSMPVLRMAGTVTASAIDDALDHHTTWELDFPLKSSQLEFYLQRAERYKGRERRVRLTGRSKRIRDVRKLIEQVADFDTTVMITGESGTGKELVAKTVHDLSDRCDKPFVPLNCGAIPSELLESELFGHEKGAFTGAISARQGRFELAEGGTLFLDEIGDMSSPMQAKLLRVLQEKAFERVGGNKTRNCNVRILAATHRDLPACVQSGDFREDLYYRLNVFPIDMPPLRGRFDDLPALLDELLVEHQVEGESRLRLTEDAVRALLNYSWPGNIRELSNLVERLAILHPSGKVDLEDLPKKYRTPSGSPVGSGRPRAVSAATDNLNLRDHLRRIEIDLIRKAMNESGGVVAKAARFLNLRRTTLVEKLNKHGLQA